MLSMPVLRNSLLMAASVVLLSSCSDSVEPDDLVGTYHATELFGEDQGTPRDLLDEGGSFTITLAADGTTTGTLFLPNAGEAGEDINASMAGTWTLDEDNKTVNFIQSADTYVRDAVWQVEGDRLESTLIFDDESFVTTVLER